MENNNYSIDRIYLHEPSGMFPAGIWVDVFAGVERRCWRCGDKTLVWLIYSYSDRVYLRLCNIDLLSFLDTGLIKPRKNGSIPTKESNFPITMFPTNFAKLDHEEFG